MTPESITEIQSRLRRVERQNRCLLTLALGVASLALFAAARKIPVAPEIRAHRFILVDARDKPIASWAGETGYAVLDFDKDQWGQPSVHLAETPEGGEIHLTSNSRGRVQLSATATNAHLLLSAGGSTSGTGSISLQAGEQCTIAIANAQDAKMQLCPGTTFPLYSYRPQGRRQWDSSADRFRLYGMKLDFCDPSGHVLQTLPGTNATPPLPR